MKPVRTSSRRSAGFAQRPARDPLGAAECRGLIALLLAAEHPDSRAERNLRADVEEDTGPQEDRVWASHLAYLETQGYVVFERRTLRGHEIPTWLITPLGLNLVDGLVASDPGVAFGGEG